MSTERHDRLSDVTVAARNRPSPGLQVLGIGRL